MQKAKIMHETSVNYFIAILQSLVSRANLNLKTMVNNIFMSTVSNFSKPLEPDTNYIGISKPHRIK